MCSSFMVLCSMVCCDTLTQCSGPLAIMKVIQIPDHFFCNQHVDYEYQMLAYWLICSQRSLLHVGVVLMKSSLPDGAFSEHPVCSTSHSLSDAIPLTTSQLSPSFHLTFATSKFNVRGAQYRCAGKVNYCNLLRRCKFKTLRNTILIQNSNLKTIFCRRYMLTSMYLL